MGLRPCWIFEAYVTSAKVIRNCSLESMLRCHGRMRSCQITNDPLLSRQMPVNIKLQFPILPQFEVSIHMAPPFATSAGPTGEVAMTRRILFKEQYARAYSLFSFCYHWRRITGWRPMVPGSPACPLSQCSCFGHHWNKCTYVSLTIKVQLGITTGKDISWLCFGASSPH